MYRSRFSPLAAGLLVPLLACLLLAGRCLAAENEETLADEPLASQDGPATVDEQPVREEAAQQQEAAEPGEGPITLDQESLEELIGTLESETARAAFLENLRALREAAAGEEEPPSVTEILKIEETSTTFISSFEEALDALGLGSNTIARLFALLLIGVGLILLAGLNRWLAIFLNHKLDRPRERLCLSRDRFALSFRVQIVAGYLLGMFIFVYAAAKLFDYWPASIAAEVLIQKTLTFLVILVLFVTLWELMNAMLEFSLGKSQRLSASRIQTLLPVTRNILLFVLALLLGLVILSEMGVNILPLLAGAGIVGIAIGFGAQTMIKDYLNGFLVIMEDLLQVGDVITVGERTGLVEKITLRKIQLRSLDGTVHTVPYSQITIVDNHTKIFSYYLIDVAVAYRENTDEVIAVLKEVDEGIRASEEFGSKILAPLEILGVDSLAESAVLIRIRSKTLAHERWAVGREFLRRIKLAFDERGIEIPFPHRKVYFGGDGISGESTR